MATNIDVVTRALRRLGIVAKDDAPGADDEAMGTEVLAGLYAEIAAIGVLMWPDDDVPSNVFLPISTLLACELAQDYSVPPPVARATALRRVLSVINADNREFEPQETEFF
jgi:hypothetical protein